MKSQQDAIVSLCALFEVLYANIVNITPYTPFFFDLAYSKLKSALPIDLQVEHINYWMKPSFL
jgi:hypothetical protein